MGTHKNHINRRQFRFVINDVQRNRAPLRIARRRVVVSRSTLSHVFSGKKLKHHLVRHMKRAVQQTLSTAEFDFQMDSCNKHLRLAGTLTLREGGTLDFPGLGENWASLGLGFMTERGEEI